MEHGDGPAWLAAIEHSGLGLALRGSSWLFPAVETVHILGFALLVGSIVTFDARVLRGVEGDDLAAWMRRVLPVSRLGFGLAAPAGALLFVTEATAYAVNPMFLAKLALVGASLANIAWFHARTHKGGVPPRASAALSIGLWLGVLVCGRLIAYV